MKNKKEIIERLEYFEGGENECVHCGSEWVVYQQYIGDAVCEECGKWQEDN